MIKKTLWTLNVENYAPEVTALTYPFMRHYAHKIGADFRVITERAFPDWPVTYEKLQIHTLGRRSDWNIYVDSDALIHPDFFDPTDHLEPDTVAHHGADMAGNRWRYDDYFRRDGRHIGSCNWFAVASKWCLDLWRPLDEPYKQVIENVFPTAIELSGIITRDHLIDDYALSRNIARFGLKFTTVRNLQAAAGIPTDSYFWHEYVITVAEKVEKLKKVIDEWKLTSYPLRSA